VVPVMLKRRPTVTQIPRPLGDEVWIMRIDHLASLCVCLWRELPSHTGLLYLLPLLEVAHCAAHGASSESLS
jgi:hypothetical protein